MVEHLFCKQEVAGSSPVLGSKCCSLEKGIVAGSATEWYISDTSKLHNTGDFSTSNCGYRIMVITLDFQSKDESSILSSRSRVCGNPRICDEHIPTICCVSEGVNTYHFL